jgi:hypothetical protein
MKQAAAQRTRAITMRTLKDAGREVDFSFMNEMTFSLVKQRF